MTLRERLQKDGWLIRHGAVPEELCRAVVTDIKSHLLGDEDGELTYPDAYGMVEMYHYQSMWNVRQLPAVHEVFAELFGTDKLWVSIDRTCCKRPLGPNDKPYSFIHWDINVNQRPRPFEVQGVVALTDTTDNMGGFQCVPQLYRELDDWLAKQPCGKAQSPGLAYPDYLGSDLVRPEMKVGDLLVWDSFLPHGNGPNVSKRTRYAQYVTMFPAGDDRLAAERAEGFVLRRPPSGWAFPGDPRGVEPRQGITWLTGLGKKLLGQMSW